ncbi:MAG: AAA family ATPase [Suilimivivens sp.]
MGIKMDVAHIKELYQSERYQEIIKESEAFEIGQITDMEVIFRVAESYRRQENWQMSALWLERLVELNDKRRYIEKLSEAYQHMDATREHWEALLKLSRGKADNVYSMAQYQLAKCNHAKDQELYELALAAAREEYQDELFFELARLCEKVNKPEEKTYYLEKIKNNSKDKDAIVSAERMIAGGEAASPAKPGKGLGQMLSKLIKGKKERIVPETIEPYFAGVKGMQAIKEELGALYHCLQQKKGNSIQVPYNFIISGQAGSGKTMLAHIIAKILYDNDLTGEEEATEINALSLMEDLSLLEQGTVVIINNAECLWQTTSDCKDGGDENKIWLAIEPILEQACENRDHFYIFLGETQQMDSLIRNNAKLKNDVTYLKIPIYSSYELHQIGLQMIQEDGCHLSKEAAEQFYQQIRRHSALGDFANGHSIRNLVIEAKKNMGYRVAQGGNADRFEEEDFILQNDSEETLEELRGKLNSMIGLSSVKEEVEQKIIFYQERENARREGIVDEEPITLNTLLLGPPGTGKTTVARLLGKIYGQIGILPRGDIFVEVTRDGLVAGYSGQTALKVDELIKKAMGGVLFIDEAYNLVTGDHDEFGREAFNTLLTRAENYRDRLMIIMAGYEEPMRQLLAANEGMKRRFPNELYFENYTEEELNQIFRSMLHARNYSLHMDAQKSVARLIKSRMGRSDFGNAGDIRNMIDGMIQKLSVRVHHDKTDNIGVRRTICRIDVENYVGKTSEEEKTLEDYLEELDNLIGLEGVKKHIHEEIKASRIAQERARRAGVQYSPGSLHMLLTGNAGTGKTTVARLIGKIYGKAGLIKSEDVFVEIRRESLVAGYMGQTGIKVAHEVDKAKGGILFIDEAYNLVNGSHDEFGREALNTLLAPIENNRDDLMVIMAGYEHEMNQLLDNNQGLRSRMNTVLNLEDYSKEQMREIFYQKAKEGGYQVEENLESFVEDFLMREKQKAKADFGNARGVRNCYEKVIKRMNARICAMEADVLTDADLQKIPDEVLNTIRREDIEE